MTRLDDLRELRDALRPQVLDQDHSEHGLQGVGALVGHYVRVLAEIEQLEAALPSEHKTPLDMLKERRDAKAQPSARAGRPAQRHK